jgi:hypothetical protein
MATEFNNLQHFLPIGTEPGHAIVVDPPRSFAQVDGSDRNKRSMDKRTDMFMITEEESRNVAWERTHPTYRPVPKMAWIKHPHATTAKVVSDTPHKESWIFRLLRSPFVAFGGTASVISAHESERARRLR